MQILLHYILFVMPSAFLAKDTTILDQFLDLFTLILSKNLHLLNTWQTSCSFFPFNDCNTNLLHCWSFAFKQTNKQNAECILFPYFCILGAKLAACQNINAFPTDMDISGIRYISEICRFSIISDKTEAEMSLEFWKRDKNNQNLGLQGKEMSADLIL